VGVYGGPDVSESGLVFAIDVANRKCISPLGCTGFNNAPQLVKNLVSTSDTINSYNGVKLGNLSYYTVFAIDYPEWSYGGDAAGRDGITPGYDVRSGTKTFGFGRALNYAVYNNPTQSWVKTSTYDSYVGTGAVDTFVSEYATAVATYPDAVHIVAGSHRDSYHTSAQYAILRDLGAPSNVDSIIGFSSPEWILVGKPGLGAGNAYGWAFQNYSTNPDQVAHLNFGLPIYGGTGNYLEFDGTNDYISLNDFSLGTQITISCWIKTSSTSFAQLIARGNNANNLGVYLSINLTTGLLSAGGNTGSGWNAQNISNSIINDNNWHYVVGVYNQSSNTVTGYVDGNIGLSRTITFETDNYSPKNTQLGRNQIDNIQFYSGNIAQVSIYNRALTASEIQQNFNANRSRFGI
jgi:hypothetical protein